MNKNKLIGIALVAAAVALVGVCAFADCGAAVGCLGKAIWYAPYAVLVVGIGRLARA